MRHVKLLIYLLVMMTHDKVTSLSCNNVKIQVSSKKCEGFLPKSITNVYFEFPFQILPKTTKIHKEKNLISLEVLKRNKKVKCLAEVVSMYQRIEELNEYLPSMKFDSYYDDNLLPPEVGENAAALS